MSPSPASRAFERLPAMTLLCMRAVISVWLPYVLPAYFRHPLRLLIPTVLTPS